MNNLTTVENVNAVQLFGSAEEMDGLLSAIEKEARSVTTSVATAKDRKEIASVANKVARSKTYLDGLRKNLVADWKKKARAVDSEGKRMRDALDKLKVEVRQPLTEWETAETARVLNIKGVIDGIRSQVVDSEEGLSSAQWEGRLEWLNSLVINDFFAEFANEAAMAKDTSIRTVTGLLSRRKAYEEEQAELVRLRREAEEKAELARVELIKRQAEERGRLAAERKAKEETERVTRERKVAERIAQEETARIERDRAAAVQRERDAERRAAEADARRKIAAEEAETRRKAAVIAAAKRELDAAELAARLERERIAAQQHADIAAAEKREADIAHRERIDNATALAFCSFGITQAQADLLIDAIRAGQIPHVTISY